MSRIKVKRPYHHGVNELTAFLNQLDQLEVLEYPTDVPRNVISDLRGRACESRDRLRRLWEESEADPEGAVERLRTEHSNLVGSLCKFLNWIRRAQSRRVPWSCVACIERLAREILPGKKLLVYCEDQYNYRIHWSRSETHAPYSYYVVALPQLHRTNVLLHAIVGHELFHPCCSKFMGRYNRNVLENIRVKCKEAKPPEPKHMEDIVRMTHEAWRRGMEELLCDMVCTTLFGPAALLAMRSFSAYSHLQAMPSPQNYFYPPWQYRFEVVWANSIKQEDLLALYGKLEKEEQLKDITKSFVEEMETFSGLSESSEGEQLVTKHPYANIAYQEVARMLPEAREFVDESFSGGLRRWNESKVLDQVPKLLLRLREGVPPSEITEIELASDGRLTRFHPIPADLTAILLTGWIYETYWQRVYGIKEGIMEYDTMSRLLLKACEDAEVLTEIYGDGS